MASSSPSKAAANSRQHIDFVLGTAPRYESEVLDRLRRRLLMFLLVVLIVSTLQGLWLVFHLLLGGNRQPDVAVVMGLRLSILAAGILALWRGTGLSLRAVRGIESAVIFLSVAVHAGTVYAHLCSATWVGTPSPPISDFSSFTSWSFAPGQGVSLSEGIGLNLLASGCAYPMACLLAGYGGLIPSTARRSLFIVGLAYADVLGTAFLASLSRPIFGPQLREIGLVAALMLTPFAALCIAAAHRIDTLSRQLFAARRLGQYTLQRKLGGGGMGDVYLASHQFLRRPCAVKLIRPELGIDRSNLVRFEREVQAMAGLSHPNAVEVFDYGRTDDGTFYYVMEYVPGLDLAELVRLYGPLPPGRVVHILRQACDALGEAHAISLIHRDIKPSNLLLCESGQRSDVVKLLDFGLVQRVASPAPQETSAPAMVTPRLAAAHDQTLPQGPSVPVPAVSPQPEPAAPPDAVSPATGGATPDALSLQVTGLGSILGTPAFMSPEQVMANAPLDARSDLYSLGCVAYFLLTGQPPFVTATAMEVMAAHIAEPAPSLRQINPTLPEDLEAVVLRCLQKQPNDRVSSAAVLAELLSGCRCARDWNSEKARSFWQQHRARATSPLAGAAPVSESVETSAHPSAASPAQPPAEDIDPTIDR